MLEKTFCDKLTNCVQSYWEKHLKDKGFLAEYYAKATGKEGGHQLADSVDDLTSATLRTEFPLQTGVQYRNGKQSPRSMGDIWICNAQKIWHPVNIKTGLVGSEGQPNLVSLKKLLNGILEHQIDAYYLCFVKFRVDKANKTLEPFVFIADLLDWLAWDAQAFVSFDSGPGQIMLKAKTFFASVEAHKFPPSDLSIAQKLDALFALYEDGERRLRENRERDLNRFRDKIREFRKDARAFYVDPTKQALLGIQ